MPETLNPSLISQLKQLLGDDSMSLQDAVERCLWISLENRGLKCALHDAVVEECGVVPPSAKRHITENELNYAWIRKSGGSK